MRILSISTAARSAVICLLLSLSLSCSAGTPSATGPTEHVQQQLFETPEQLVEALKVAAAAEDSMALLKILGSDGQKLLFSGDPTLDRLELRQLSKRLSERAELMPYQSEEFSNLSVMKLRIGRMGLNAGIPLVSDGKGWRTASRYFAPRSLKRRMSTNEIQVWRTCREYVEAQRHYFARDRNGDGVQEYAQQFLSSPGKQDGLYWFADLGQERSPLAEVIDLAQKAGYQMPSAGAEPQPLYGYKFKVLTKQGRWARDGARDYMQDGRLIKGFALVAYPVEWGVSGLRTFVVGPHGIIHGKNLGVSTDSIVEDMQEFNPDRSWPWIQQPQVNDLEEYLEGL
jgi:hypothetical protein